MSAVVWRGVQEAIYQRWAAGWVVDPLAVEPEPFSPYAFANEKFDPPEALWADVRVIRLPGGSGTLGPPGRRKMDRVGELIIDLREPPGDGVGRLSEAAEKAAKIFENCRLLATHDIRFAAVEPGEETDIDKGRWWGVSVRGRFEYEDIN